MAINWKEVLGDSYTEELEKTINTLIGKDYVSKSDFNDRGNKLREHEKTISEQTKELENLRQTNVDAAAMQKQIDDLKAAHAAELNKLTIRQIAYIAAAKAGAIDPEQVVLLLAPQLETAELSEDRKSVDGMDSWVQALVEGKGTSGMFSKADGTNIEIDGAEPAHPGNKGGAKDVDMNNGTYSQYVAAHPNNT